MRVAARAVLAVTLAAGLPLLVAADPLPKLDRAGQRWVEKTLKKMTIEERVGQLVVPALSGVFTSLDSERYEDLERLIQQHKVGGFHVFGGGERLPPVLLNPGYGRGWRGRKADAFGTAMLLNRLQRRSRVPLLFTADFEGGAGYIVAGATRVPRAMALAAGGDLELIARAGEITAREGRSLGVHVNFYPVVDVNNNPENPIINMRSFGESPQAVGRYAAALIRGLRRGGMLSTAKHFPGHGDTDVDTHLDLAVIAHSRERIDTVELPPFRAAVDAGVDAVMTSHIHLPALDPTPGLPATLSQPILTGLLRNDMKFQGLIFTDSMSMYAVSKRFDAGRAAVLAVQAGADVVLHSPDSAAAVRALRAAVGRGEIPQARIDASVRRILEAKARLGLHQQRQTDVDALTSSLGGRAREGAADEMAARAITLLKDEHGHVPLKLPRQARLLYLSIIDYASGWREGFPSRTLLRELRRRFDDVVGVEISDRTTANELDLVRQLARRSDAVLAGTFVRIASYSGRMDLSAAQVELLEDLGADAARPFVVVVFGNPYTAVLAPKLPAVLLTYEYSDAMERAAVQALAGEAAIGGKLPITLPELYPLGHGLTRPTPR